MRRHKGIAVIAMREPNGDSHLSVKAEDLTATVVHECRAQMAVELAVLMPVIIIVALIAVNVLTYASLCARFDRVSYNAVFVAGVAPTGAADAYSSVAEVKTQIESAMDADACEVEVSAENIGIHEGDALINLAAGTVRYVCTLSYHPWPLRASIAGALFAAPSVLKHERSLVVDCYKAAIIT